MRLIDAEALKKQFEDRTLEDFTCYHFIEAIDNAPSVPLPDFKEGYKRAIIDGKTNFSRPHGEWIEHYSKELSDKGFYLCSRCKAGFQRYERGVRHSDLPWINGQKYELHCIDNFCPNCGADMRKEKDDE